MENYPSTMIMLVRSREIISKVIWRFKNSWCWADRQTSSRRSLKVTSQLDSAVEIQVASESDVPNDRGSATCITNTNLFAAPTTLCALANDLTIAIHLLHLVMIMQPMFCYTLTTTLKIKPINRFFVLQ